MAEKVSRNAQARLEGWAVKRSTSIIAMSAIFGGLGGVGIQLMPYMPLRILSAALSIGCVVTATYVSWLADRETKRQREKAKREAVEFVEAFDYQVGPVVKRLAELAAMGSANGKERCAALCSQIVAAAAALPGTDGVRASIYERQKRTFVPREDFTVGRSDMPRTKFTNRNVEGRAVWELAEAGTTRFCEDVHHDPPPGFDPAISRHYRTFITAPVMHNETPVGLLTVNAGKPGDLTEQDARTMTILAALLATTYALGGSKWPSAGA